jgi:hypothetical protein
VTVNRKTANFGIRVLRNLFANHCTFDYIYNICVLKEPSSFKSRVACSPDYGAPLLFSSEAKRPKIVSLRSEKSLA